MPYSYDVKLKSHELRRLGYLLSDIAKELGVTKSTVHSWTNGMILTVYIRKTIL